MLKIDDLFPDMDDAKRQAFAAAPDSLMAVGAKIDYREALPLDDPRYVSTADARDEMFKDNFFRAFGYDRTADFFVSQELGKHVLFFGHVGCGKSTELVRMCKTLNDPSRYWVIQVDLLDLIDPHDARYSDVWLAVTQSLLKRINDENIAVDPVVVKGLMQWFTQRILTRDVFGEMSGEVKIEAEAKAGIPGIFTLLARATSSIKAGSSYRETIREAVRNTYADFVSALNQVIADVDQKIRSAGKGRQILFVIDGADRFRGEDWRRLFIDEVNQLAQVKCVAVYTAPLALKSCGTRFDLFEPLTLPMVKLYAFDAAKTRREVAFTAMREVLLKRCHANLFESPDVLDRLITYGGGHLRDMLRLLNYACITSRTGRIDSDAVEAAAKRLAGDYRAWLKIEYYPILASFAQDPENQGIGDDINALVENGALLEYNDGSWRQPHPVLTLLPAYQRAYQKPVPSP